MLGFIVRAGFWLVLVAAFLPHALQEVDKGSQPTGPDDLNRQAHQAAVESVTNAAQTANAVCEAHTAVCEAASETAQMTGRLASLGAQMARDAWDARTPQTADDPAPEPELEPDDIKDQPKSKRPSPP